jgi:hypothetical protein
MAGTATVRVDVILTDIGSVGPISTEFTQTGVDEFSHRRTTIAASGNTAIDFGDVSTAQGIVVKVWSGGTTDATGVEVYLVSQTYADQDYNLVLVSGQSYVWRMPSVLANITNLSSSVAADVEYLVWGEA